jgi:hypothetical protein
MMVSFAFRSLESSMKKVADMSNCGFKEFSLSSTLRTRPYKDALRSRSRGNQRGADDSFAFRNTLIDENYGFAQDSASGVNDLKLTSRVSGSIWRPVHR